MNGAEVLVHTLLAGGIDACFTNPGTSEMHFVAALDRVAGVRCVLGLFEGVVTGAADGYARMADRPAATLLHLGPGLANGLANVHNARRAWTPMVNIVGDHAHAHRHLDAPLTSDIEGLARPMSDWVRTIGDADAVGPDTAEAIRQARTPPGRIATLVLPADAAWTEASGGGAPALTPPARPRVGDAALAEAVAAIRSGRVTTLMLSSVALRAGTLETAGRIAAKAGVKLMAQLSNGRMQRGAGRVPIRKVPYPVDQALAALAGTEHLILVGARPPVAFFAYPGKPSRTSPPGCRITALAGPGDDLAHALAALAEALGAGDAKPALAPAAAPPLPRGALTGDAVIQAVAALLPEGAIIADESITAGRRLFDFTDGAAPHDYLQVTGGAIGCGPPLATGAAVAAPGRKVVNLEGDGSALYTLQALWTQARERLDVTTVIFANRSYAILHNELRAVGAAAPGEQARRMLDLDSPAPDWVRLAGGFGVEAARADTAERFADLFGTAMRRPGPFLIEAVI